MAWLASDASTTIIVTLFTCSLVLNDVFYKKKLFQVNACERVLYDTDAKTNVRGHTAPQPNQKKKTFV